MQSIKNNHIKNIFIEIYLGYILHYIFPIIFALLQHRQTEEYFNFANI